jgi:hypothetical protein
MIIFSKLTVTASTGETCTGLVSGIPCGFSDLEGWMFFEDFLNELGSCSVEVKVQTFGYGEGDACTATVEEVAYMYKRLAMRPDFLESRCEAIDNHQFSFDWEPSELFG